MIGALLAFALVLTFFGGVMLVTQFLSIFTAAPYVPTSNDRVKRMIEIAELKPGECAVDLGSGDGRLVFAAAEAGANAEGWEANPLLALRSMLSSRTLVCRDRIVIHSESYHGVDLHEIDVVFLYVLSSEMARLERWLPLALKPGARIVVHAFPFPTWKPEYQEGHFFRYRVPSISSR